MPGPTTDPGPFPMADDPRQRWGRVSELFDAALQRPPEQREALLREACEGDAALKNQVEE